MRVFKTRWFVRFARRAGLSNGKLTEAIKEIESRLYEADLGGDLIKKRIARTGGGKSGEYRTIIAYCKGSRAVFLYGFAKNNKENISPVELQELQKAARQFLKLSEQDIGKTLEEIGYGEEEVS